MFELLDKKAAQKVSMVNNYQCTNYHVGHYCTVFTTEDKENPEAIIISELGL